MKKFFCFVLSTFLIFNLYSNTSSSQAANRKTALRYLQLAKNYLVQNDFAAVKKTCESGLQYDSQIADLYYLEALSLFNLDHPRYEILPVIKKSLAATEWVDYNMTNARVFYADLLSSTGKPDEAIAVLDKAPLIYSSDAEYVRIKSLYQLNTAESILKAEEKIDSARRVYPNDVRFFYLFFNYEYNIHYVEREDKSGFDKTELSPVAKKIAASFIIHVPDYDKEFKDLEILASVFAEGENQKRLLKAFNARGFNHILYPVIALESGIISQEEALDYFLTFIDGEIEAKLLFQFYTMITEENLKKYFDEHLDAFNGTLIYDTNNNLEENLRVSYERGRADKIIFDCNNDQNIEWEVECDFGVPKTVKVFDQDAIVVYGTYPNVNSIAFEDVEPAVKGLTVYGIIDESLESKPFEIIKAPEVKSTDFYVIDWTTLAFGKSLFDTDKIILSSNVMDKPSLERKGARIKFSILNGVPYKASYYSGDREYAEAQFFEDQVCCVRNVDKDSDGIFETTEFYSINNGFYISDEDKAAITTNIWGSPVSDANLYLSEIQIDRNLDTIIDFKESYYNLGGVSTRWDSDFDGEFDIVYEKFSAEKDKPVRERDSYYITDIIKGKYWVSVTKENGIPVSVKEDDTEIPVIKGKNKNFFWLEAEASAGYEINILSAVNQYAQGQMFQMDEADCYIRIIRIGENVFARKFNKESENENEIENQ